MSALHHRSPGTGAAAGLGGGSTGHSGPVPPPTSPCLALLGRGDGATAASATSTRADASEHPGGAPVARNRPAPPTIPFDLLLRGWR